MWLIKTNLKNSAKTKLFYKLQNRPQNGRQKQSRYIFAHTSSQPFIPLSPWNVLCLFIKRLDVCIARLPGNSKMELYSHSKCVKQPITNVIWLHEMKAINKNEKKLTLV